MYKIQRRNNASKIKVCDKRSSNKNIAKNSFVAKLQVTSKKNLSFSALNLTLSNLWFSLLISWLTVDFPFSLSPHRSLFFWNFHFYESIVDYCAKKGTSISFSYHHCLNEFHNEKLMYNLLSRKRKREKAFLKWRNDDGRCANVFMRI